MVGTGVDGLGVLYPGMLTYIGIMDARNRRSEYVGSAEGSAEGSEVGMVKVGKKVDGALLGTPRAVYAYCDPLPQGAIRYLGAMGVTLGMALEGASVVGCIEGVHVAPACLRQRVCI